MKASTRFRAHKRFVGNLRYHHRSPATTKRDWDEWVNQTCGKSRKCLKRGEIVAITFVVLVLAAIVSGLLVELGWFRIP
jgi:hypothetical protein